MLRRPAWATLLLWGAAVWLAGLCAVVGVTAAGIAGATRDVGADLAIEACGDGDDPSDVTCRQSLLNRTGIVAVTAALVRAEPVPIAVGLLPALAALLAWTAIRWRRRD